MVRAGLLICSRPYGVPAAYQQAMQRQPRTGRHL